MEFQTTQAWLTEAAAMVVAMVTVTVAAMELEKSAVTAVPVVRQEDRRRID